VQGVGLIVGAGARPAQNPAEDSASGGVLDSDADGTDTLSSPSVPSPEPLSMQSIIAHGLRRLVIRLRNTLWCTRTATTATLVQSHLYRLWPEVRSGSHPLRVLS